jgi:hypothetical protein
MADDKRFLLCIGAPKCGTTWLREYVHAAPCADMGRLGEYQVWDALHLPENARFRVPRPGAARRLRGALAGALGLPMPADVFRWRLQDDPARYFAYFERLLAQPGITLTGDVSPGYNRLPAEVLSRIDREFASRGVEVRAVLLLRDPIERAWSGLRMERRKGRLPEGRSDAEVFLDRYVAGNAPPNTPRYAKSLAALERAFPPERRRVCLYESLFRPESIADLSRWLGIPARPEAGSQRVNAAGAPSALPDGLADEAAAWFAEDYAATVARLPEARRLWPHASLLEAAG